ncbi:MAG: heme ABC exporter ATP-binding protein CcmA [Inhella sp.]
METTAPTPELLRTDALVCARAERALFAPLGLALRAGEAVWLRGANGSGKTTLLRTLAGLGQPFAGRFHCPRPPRYLGHANGLKDELTVAENLRLAAALQGQACGNTELKAALQALGLGGLARRPARQLSQGQRRRTALARLALPAPAALWLLDEPFDALDQEGLATLRGLLQGLLAAGSALLFTSHQELTGLATREVQLEPSA